MTQEEILEFNKRCAEFLGILYGIRQNGIVKEESKVRIRKILDLEETVGLHINYCKFHSDWNWINEVIEAIESIKYKTSGEPIYTVAISNRVCKIDTVNDEIVWTKAKTKKEAVVFAVNQFLIWYNENKIN